MYYDPYVFNVKIFKYFRYIVAVSFISGGNPEKSTIYILFMMLSIIIHVQGGQPNL